jgi:hypothetical protein
MSDIAKKLRDMVALAARSCDPEYNRALRDAAAEIEQLRHHIAALVEILRDKPCPSDGRSTIGGCQQCGCSEGLLTRDAP